MRQAKKDQKEALLTILAQNINIRRSALPLPSRAHTAWAKGLGLKRGGRTVLYTGHMYQMLPYLMALQRQRRAVPPGVQPLLMRLTRAANPLLNLSYLGTRGKVHPGLRTQCNEILRNIAVLLLKNEIDIGYLYERDLYAGTLAYDLGLDDVFEKHAHRVARAFKEAGVKAVITVDPHSTEILRNVYPRVVKGFDIDVRPYFTALLEKGAKGVARLDGAHVTIHDSCIYARYLGCMEEPRKLMRIAGASLSDVRFSREITHCCGGPIETLVPGKAREIAQARSQELNGAGGDIIATMCPICHLNLSEADTPGKRVEDIASLLARKEAGKRT